MGIKVCLMHPQSISYIKLDYFFMWETKEKKTYILKLKLLMENEILILISGEILGVICELPYNIFFQSWHHSVGIFSVEQTRNNDV